MDVEPKMGVKNPKWMVKIRENPVKMDDLGVPIIFGNTHIASFASYTWSWFALVFSSLSQKQSPGWRLQKVQDWGFPIHKNFPVLLT